MKNSYTLGDGTVGLEVGVPTSLPERRPIRVVKVEEEDLKSKHQRTQGRTEVKCHSSAVYRRDATARVPCTGVAQSRLRCHRRSAECT